MGLACAVQVGCQCVRDQQALSRGRQGSAACRAKAWGWLQDDVAPAARRCKATGTGGAGCWAGAVVAWQSRSIEHERGHAAASGAAKAGQRGRGMSLKDIPHEDIQGFCVHKEQ